jgi:hypothetical protein
LVVVVEGERVFGVVIDLRARSEDESGKLHHRYHLRKEHDEFPSCEA